MTLFETEPTFSVGELGEVLRELLAVTFTDDVWVHGEVRNIKRPRSGHVYFDLVEPSSVPGRAPDALLSVMLFRSTKDIVNQQLRRAGGGMRIDDGVVVRIRCVPDFYPPQGRLQVRMTGIDPTYTLGQLVAQRERLLEILAEEGLVARNAGLPFPRLPQRIGLVTAAGSAAHADFLHELERSAVAWHVVLVDTPVQGDGAVHAVAAGLAACDRAGVDVIAVVRGGGARTDLAIFDHEVVARAIAARSVPVLTGIGHEIDTSVADAVAHLALKTPTACANHLVEAARRFDQATELAAGRLVAAAERVLADRHTELAALSGEIRHRTTTRLARADARLDRTQDRIVARAPNIVAAATRLLDRHATRLCRRATETLADADRTVRSLEAQRRLLDPRALLARGWSITRTTDGTVVTSPAQVEPGQTMVTELHDGTIASTAIESPAPDPTTQPEEP